jgi:hypothetical protein
MADESKQNVSLIVEALRESHRAQSVALLTVGELASEEIKSRDRERKMRRSVTSVRPW